MKDNPKDRQRALCYSWEEASIRPIDRTVVPFAQIEGIVKYVWQEFGLEFPPEVERLPKQTKKLAGDACRLKVRFGPTTRTWIILHELAHSMTSLHDDRSNGHGALFMGIYCQLLARFYHLDFDKLVQSAKDWGLRVKPDARPVFL